MLGEMNVVAPREIVTVVRSSAFFASQRRDDNQFGDGVKIGQLQRASFRCGSEPRTHAAEFEIHCGQAACVPEESGILPHLLLQISQQGWHVENGLSCELWRG